MNKDTIYFNVNQNKFELEQNHNHSNSYIEYRKGNVPDMITEHYLLPDDKRIDYSYSNSIQKFLDNTTLDEMRNNFLNKNGVTDCKIYAITVPEDLFNTYLEGIKQ